MTNGTSEVRSVLKDLTLSGAVIVHKRKLLWMLGWGQDRPGAWAGLLDHWKELGENPNDLYGIDVSEKIILLTSHTRPAVNPVAEWAGRM